ncbi:TPA: GMP synthase (glutamine-hydrolyzing) [bacterium]|nr:GMP synthase (glutamine-hydrolyzing) [bacterium]
MERETIAVLDFGSQYTQLIARKIRELKVFSIILPYNTTVSELKRYNLKGIILSGGPASVYIQGAPSGDVRIFDLDIPILGICYGTQWIIHILNGKVKRAQKQEYGSAELIIMDFLNLFWGITGTMEVWMSYGDIIEELPEGFEIIGITANSPYAAIRNPERQIYCLQFHPEVTRTPLGKEIIANFLFDRICGCSPNWLIESFIDEKIEEIRSKVGTSRAICGLSGSVDSSTAAVLAHYAIGKNLTCIFIDNGLLRKREKEMIIRAFKDSLKIELVYVDAKDEFLKVLSGITDPKEKRKRIEHKLIEVFEREARKVDGVEFLIQGTLYPDIIENERVSRYSAKIKVYHNGDWFPNTMNFKPIEPFKELFNDEVREIALQLGLPDEIVYRQSFPSSGLAIRIIGEVNEKNLSILKEADSIIQDEIEKNGLYRDIWQSFAVMLPGKSVGVTGDERIYGNVIAIRAVVSTDGMTTEWAELPYEILGKMATRIVNEVPSINRVVYDITPKPPGTIEWE